MLGADAAPEHNGALTHGDVVIAAITSCTNTSNPSVMVAAGLLAKAAVARGLTSRPWVKTSLAPGSRVVTDYLERAGLTEPLEALGFHLVGYGCTTCIGNSGPLPEEVSRAVGERDLAVAAVLSGNRNFEGRIQSEVKLNYLASPPLVVAFAIAGTMDIDLESDPLGVDRDGHPVLLRDIWPSSHEIAATVEDALRSDMFHSSYAEVFDGDERWRSLEVPAATATTGASRPTSAGRRSSTGCPPRRPRSRTSRARARSRCWAIRSRPTTSRPRDRFAATAPPGATCRSTAWPPPTSTPTARGAATTR